MTILQVKKIIAETTADDVNAIIIANKVRGSVITSHIKDKFTGIEYLCCVVYDDSYRTFISAMGEHGIFYNKSKHDHFYDFAGPTHILEVAESPLIDKHNCGIKNCWGFVEVPK